MKHGVSMLANDGQFHTPAAVWERGVPGFLLRN